MSLLQGIDTMKINERDMLLTLATMALTMDDLTGHDVIESLNELGYGDVVSQARNASQKSQKKRVRRSLTMTTSEPVGAWRKCQLYFEAPWDAVVVGHELSVSRGGSILPGSILESVHPTLSAEDRTFIRIANGDSEQFVTLTLIIEPSK